MSNHEEHQHSNNFWSGFSLGILAGGGIMYLFATKRGRKLIQNLLENSDTLEGNLESILQMIQKNIVVDKEDKQEEKKK